MKRFFKVFFTTFFISMLTLAIGFFVYIRIFNPLDDIISNNDDFEINDDNIDIDSENLTPFEHAIKHSKRINVLVVGLEHTRTDTIMVASYDRKGNLGNIISVPRDTYYERKGYSGGSLKINAVYQSEGIEGLKKAVESILNIPIHRYVTVDYNAVIAGVDALGGIDIEIPFHMYYSDPYSDPPLLVDIPEGLQHLDGKTALGFLRYRHGYANADIGRIEAQQKFIKETVKKLMSFKLPAFIQKVYPYIKTDFSITELISLAADAAGFSPDNLTTTIVPGGGKYIGKVSFYMPNYEEALKLSYEMYGITDSTDEENAENTENTGTTDKNS